MGDLKNQIFLQYINEAINHTRAEYVQRHTPKKENRFLIKGTTYEISPCRFEEGGFVYEISSKIPQELLSQKKGIEQYYRKVIKIMNSTSKKPTEAKMENIIYNTTEMEHKERDYVKLIYKYAESELFTADEIDKRFKKHQSKNIPIPDIPGIATPSGKLVIILVGEKMAKYLKQNVNDLINANEEVKIILKKELEKQHSKPKSKPTVKTKAAAKPKARPKAKPSAKAKTKTNPKPAAKASVKPSVKGKSAAKTKANPKPKSPTAKKKKK